MQFIRRGVQEMNRNLGGGNVRFSLTVGVENEAEWVPGANFKQWTSPDGTRQIDIYESDGLKCGGTGVKTVGLSAIAKIGGGKIMAVQEVIHPDGAVEWNVHLDVTTDREEGEWPTVASAMYSTSDGGKLYLPHPSSAPMKLGQYEKMSDEDFERLYRAEKAKNGIRHASELPEYIDVEVTIALFIDQISRNDLSRPVLVKREPSPEE